MVGREVAQALQHLAQRGGVHPVVGIHHLEVEAGGVAQSGVDGAAVPGVFLVDGAHDAGMLLLVVAGDGKRVVGGTVVDDEDLHLFAAGQQRIDAAAHIGGGVVAGNGEGNEL